MSLLNKTILYFFPAEAHLCAFVEEPWFQENYEIQVKVLRICYEGYAQLIETSPNENTFSSHIYCLLDILDIEIDNIFLEELVKDFGDNSYVVWRSICNSEQLQLKILLIKMYDYSHLVNTVDNACEFDIHLDTIIEQIQTNIRMESEAVLAGEISEDNIEVPQAKRCIVELFKDEMSGVLVFVD
jgi:hypothetical protein